METELGIKDLKEQLADIQRRHPAFKDDDLFVCWFLRAYWSDDDTSAARAVTGGTGDKNVDAVLVDHKAQAVVVVQGKHRQTVKGKTESRNDVLGFARLVGPIVSEDAKQFKSLCAKCHADVVKKLTEARTAISKQNYRLRMFYVTLGSVSEQIVNEASEVVAEESPNAVLEVFDGDRVMHLLRDYLDGVAPPIPSLDLEIEQHQDVHVSGVLQRYDRTNRVESWVFSMRGDAVARLFESAGVRLYARNIRGFLGGDTSVNKGMLKTLEKEPDHFFYYNNGITIICDRAEKRSRNGAEYLRVGNPQIINGQQTSRMLVACSEQAANASVLVKVMQVPRKPGLSGGDGFDNLVSNIVGNTNWQNAIKHADLVSNDRAQIEIDRSFRKLEYVYLRKREKKSETPQRGGKSFFVVKKEELAQAVAACELDPLVVRQGKDRLFRDHYDRLFKSGQDPHYYLCRYWARRFISKASRGDEVRPYGKWLALHFLWSQLNPILASTEVMRRFRSASEHTDEALLAPVNALVEQVFLEVVAFYRANKGRGADALDPSRFFKMKDRHKEFREFWKKRDVQKAADSLLAEIRSVLVLA